MSTLSILKTWVTGDVLTATDLNAEFSNILNDYNGSIVNANISASAAIGLSKLATGALPTGITIASANLVDGTIVNADINASAAIAYSKLTLTGSILDADVNASAAISLSKLATGALPTGITIASANLVDGTIVNADVNTSAAIDLSKLATGALPTAITVASANLVDGTIVNADVNASAAINESKILFAAAGHGHTGTTDGKVITINRAFSWYLDGTSIVADEVGAKYIAPQNITVVKIWYKLVSGTCTIRLQKGTTDIDAGNDVTSTLGSTTTITTAAITAGDVITLDITAASSPVGLTVTVECTQP